MIRKVAFFRHRSQDVDADKRFWGELLGLPLVNEFENQWLEFETPEGKTIAVETMSPEDSPPSIALETDDIDAAVTRLRDGGVEIEGEILDHKVCKMVVIRDPSGNKILLHEIAPERRTD